MRLAVWTACLLAMAIGSGAATAQQTKAAGPAAAAPPPVSADPAMTSATYGDWQLRCQRVGDGAAARKLCEVAQTIQLQGQQAPSAELALGRLPGDAALRLTAVLPPSVSFPSTVRFATPDKALQTLDLQWRRCISGGCFAEGTPPADLLKTWRSLTDSGSLTFTDATGHDRALPVSFRGLAQALDALAKS